MARYARIRDSFTKDVTSLSRLKEAIERDTKRTPEFRKKAKHLIDELIFLLLDKLR